MAQNKNSKNHLSPLLHLTFVLQQKLDQILLGSVGVSLSQVRIMSTLSFSVAISQRAVALELRQTEANISRQLKAMKQQGLVSITKNKKDSRQRDVRLTRKGQAKFQSALKVLNSHQKNQFKLMDKKSQIDFNQVVKNLLLSL